MIAMLRSWNYPESEAGRGCPHIREKCGEFKVASWCAALTAQPGRSAARFWAGSAWPEKPRTKPFAPPSVLRVSDSSQASTPAAARIPAPADGGVQVRSIHGHGHVPGADRLEGAPCRGIARILQPGRVARPQEGFGTELPIRTVIGAPEPCQRLAAGVERPANSSCWLPGGAAAEAALAEAYAKAYPGWPSLLRSPERAGAQEREISHRHPGRLRPVLAATPPQDEPGACARPGPSVLVMVRLMPMLLARTALIWRGGPVCHRTAYVARPDSLPASTQPANQAPSGKPSITAGRRSKRRRPIHGTPCRTAAGMIRPCQSGPRSAD